MDKKPEIQKGKPQKVSPPPGLFGQRKELSRIEVQRSILKKPYIPGTGGKFYKKPELKKMLEEEFPRKRFGTHLHEREVQKRLREWKMERFRAKTSKERLEMDRKIRYWEERLKRG